MPLPPLSNRLSGAVERSNYPSLVKLPRKEFEQTLARFLEARPDDGGLVELSWASLCQRPDGRGLSSDSSLVVLFQDGIRILTPRGLVKKRLDDKFVSHGSYVAAIPDELTSPDRANCDFAIQFLGPGNTPLFRIAWEFFTGGNRDTSAERMSAAAERDRILSALNGM